MKIRTTFCFAIGLSALSMAAPASASDLVLYDALDFAGPVAKAFQAKTGLTVDVVEPGSTGETLGKIAAEGSNPQFDIVWLDGSAVMERMAADHVLQAIPAAAYDKVEFTDLGKSLIPQSHAFLPTGTSTTAIEVNTKKVPADKMPKSWADLQAFAGSVAAKDPNLSGPAYQWLAGFFQTNGLDAGKALLAKTLTNKSLSGLSSGGKVNKAVLTGDASVGINQDSAIFVEDRRRRTRRRGLPERRFGVAAARPRHQRQDPAHGCGAEVHRLRHQRRRPGRHAERRRHGLLLHSRSSTASTPSPAARPTSPTPISTMPWLPPTRLSGSSGTRTISSSDAVVRAVPAPVDWAVLAMTSLQHSGAAALVGVGTGKLRRGGLSTLVRGGGPFAVYAVFALLIGLPLALVLVQAVMPGLFAAQDASSALSLEPLAHVFNSPHVAGSVLHSLELGMLVAFTTTALGGAFAVLVQRCDIPLRTVISAVPWLVFLTPAYLKALAWVLLMSPGGYLAQFGLLPAWLGASFFGLTGLVFVHTLSLFPLAAFIIGSALAGLGSELEDAARLSGAAPLRIWLRINGPLLAPAIALSFIATFAEVLSDFGLASTIARMSNFGVLTYGIYAAASDYPVDFPAAGAQALVLLGLVLLVVVADRLLRRRADPRLISGRARPARLYDLGRWRWLAIGGGPRHRFPGAGLAARRDRRACPDADAGHGLHLEQFHHGQFGGGAQPEHRRPMTACCAASSMPALTALIASGRRLAACRRSSIAPARCMRTARRRPVARRGRHTGHRARLRLYPRLESPARFPRLAVSALWRWIAAGHGLCRGSASLLPGGDPVGHRPAGAEPDGCGATARRRDDRGDCWRSPCRWSSLSVVTAFLLTFIRTVFELPISQMLIPQSGPPAPTLILKLFSHDRDGLASAIALVAMAAAGIGAALVWFPFRRFVKPRRSAGPVEAGGRQIAEAGTLS